MCDPEEALAGLLRTSMGQGSMPLQCVLMESKGMNYEPLGGEAVLLSQSPELREGEVVVVNSQLLGSSTELIHDLPLVGRAWQG